MPFAAARTLLEPHQLLAVLLVLVVRALLRFFVSPSGPVLPQLAVASVLLHLLLFSVYVAFFLLLTGQYAPLWISLAFPVRWRFQVDSHSR